MSDDNRPIVTPRLLVGGWIAIMGVVLMLDRIGIVDARQAFRLWPLILIAAGAGLYFQRPQHAGHVNGIILMAIGAWLLLTSFGVIRVRFWELFWPLVLIGGGTALVMQTLKRGGAAGAAGDEMHEHLTMLAVLSSVHRTSAAVRFRGGDLAAFMGGGRLDLRQAIIPDGEQATLDVLMMMGGFEIFVPPTWVVTTPIVPFMGTVEDHRLAPTGSVAGGAAANPAAPRLVLRGFMMMGAVHIKS